MCFEVSLLSEYCSLPLGKTLQVFRVSAIYIFSLGFREQGHAAGKDALQFDSKAQYTSLLDAKNQTRSCVNLLSVLHPCGSVYKSSCRPFMGVKCSQYTLLLARAQYNRCSFVRGWENREKVNMKSIKILHHKELSCITLKKNWKGNFSKVLSKQTENHFYACYKTDLPTGLITIADSYMKCLLYKRYICIINNEY